MAFAEKSLQESSRLVNPGVRRSVQVYLAEVALIVDNPLFEDRRETGWGAQKGNLKTAVLIAGDLDFRPAVEPLVEEGVTVEVSEELYTHG